MKKILVCLMLIAPVVINAAATLRERRASTMAAMNGHARRQRRASADNAKIGKPVTVPRPGLSEQYDFWAEKRKQERINANHLKNPKDEAKGVDAIEHLELLLNRNRIAAAGAGATSLEELRRTGPISPKLSQKTGQRAAPPSLEKLSTALKELRRTGRRASAGAGASAEEAVS